jgi:GT2 family glycosyltransferase
LRDITLSVVSHAQNTLTNKLLGDIARHCAERVTVLLVENIADREPLAISGAPFPIEVIANERAKGFGANHNAAFARCSTPFFCVMNPDLRLHADPFTSLLRAMSDERVALVAPLVRSPGGGVEDSARRFPTTRSLIAKLFRKGPIAEYAIDRGALEVDWVAGMCMLFRYNDYRHVGGFDEAYFLYYEDVDICWRLKKLGRKVLYEPAAEVTHAARRASRRDPRLARHHLHGMARFLSRRAFD